MSKKIGKNLNNKFSQKLLDSARKSMTDVTKTASKTAEPTGDLIGNKIADKITSGSKTSPQNALRPYENEIEIPQKHIYLRKNDNKLFMN